MVILVFNHVIQFANLLLKLSFLALMMLVGLAELLKSLIQFFNLLIHLFDLLLLAIDEVACCLMRLVFCFQRGCLDGRGFGLS